VKVNNSTNINKTKESLNCEGQQFYQYQQEISIFINSSHLEWRAGLSDAILKGTHTRTIPARFGLIWFRGFRGEDLNVKVYDVRRTQSDGKSSPGLWPSELKNQAECFNIFNYLYKNFHLQMS
jgi:hypothetical protein